MEHLASLDALLVFGAGDGARAQPGGAGAGRRRRRSALGGAARPADPAVAARRAPGRRAGARTPRSGCARDGALLTAALQVGHAAEALDLAVAYAKERHQFGKPIGSFQAVKHMCADMLVRAEVARAAVHAAACLADEPDVVGAEAEAAGCTPGAAASSAPSAAPSCWPTRPRWPTPGRAIQVHGGMGFTWEVPLHLHLKRSRVLCDHLRHPGRAGGRPGRVRLSEPRPASTRPERHR